MGAAGYMQRSRERGVIWPSAAERRQPQMQCNILAPHAGVRLIFKCIPSCLAASPFWAVLLVRCRAAGGIFLPVSVLGCSLPGAAGCRDGGSAMRGFLRRAEIRGLCSGGGSWGEPAAVQRLHPVGTSRCPLTCHPLPAPSPLPGSRSLQRSGKMQISSQSVPPAPVQRDVRVMGVQKKK